MTELSPCSGCRRHARPDAPCPFCGASVPRPPPARRLGAGATRAMILSLGVALGASACGDDRGAVDASAPGRDGGALADGGPAVDAGADDDAGAPSEDAGPPDSGLVVTPYGAPAVDHLV